MPEKVSSFVYFLLGVMLLLAQPILAGEINSGSLVIEGKAIEAPYRVKIAGNRVLVNEIQAYPHAPGRAEVKEKKAKEDTQEFLKILHKQFLEKKKLHGHDNAAKWLRGTIESNGRYKNYTVNETKLGLEVDLQGKGSAPDAAFLRYIREDNSPSRMEQISKVRDGLVKKYGHWRRAKGRSPALDLIDQALQKESLIEEFRLNRDRESFWVKWKGQPYGGTIGLWPEGYGDNPPDQKERESRRVKFQAEEIERPLKKGRCVLVLSGATFSSFYGKTACETVLQIIHDKPAEDVGLPLLRENFNGREVHIWKRLERLWQE